MISTTQIGADFAAVLTDWGQTLTFGAASGSAVRGTVRHIEDIELAGLREHYRFSVWIRQANWSALPDVDDVVSFGGKTYRIIALSDDPGNVTRRLDLGEQYAE